VDCIQIRMTERELFAAHGVDRQRVA
jgi:hypothetical protein